MKTLSENQAEINSDPILTLATETFIAEYLNKADNYPDNHDLTYSNIETLWTIDRGKYFTIKEADRKRLSYQIVKRKRAKGLLKEAYNYAKSYPEEAICKEVIQEYESSIPKTIEHTQTDRISVTEKKEVAKVDYTINLFKSKQEIEFFAALKMTYDSYQIYPNVSISCLLDWQKLKEELTSAEKEYFFKGIVDFVVFDQAEGFKPIHFFEIDSALHDSEDRKKKDGLKDSIFAKAGISIKRIRKKDPNVSQQEFVKLIRELMK